jgi:hypothetical protein
VRCRLVPSGDIHGHPVRFQSFLSNIFIEVLPRLKYSSTKTLSNKKYLRYILQTYGSCLKKQKSKLAKNNVKQVFVHLNSTLISLQVKKMASSKRKNPQIARKKQNTIGLFNIAMENPS